MDLKPGEPGSIMTNEKKLVSVVIPAMNEEGNIGCVLDDLSATIEKIREYEFEIIVVNDGSKDRTPSIALSKNAKVIDNKRGRGKGNALITGFENAGGDYLVMMDGDYSHRPEDMPNLIQPLENGAGLVIGSRIYGGSEEYTRIRAFGNIILTLIFGLFHKRYLSDALNGYKCFRSEIFKNFIYTSKDFEIEIELLVNTLRTGHKIVEVSSHERIRRSGSPKSRPIKHGLKFFNRILLEWLRNKSISKNFRKK